MSRSTQSKIATVVAATLLLIYVGCMLVYDEGVRHYWVDESEGPTYVKYAYTPAEVTRRQIILIVFGVGFVVVVYLLIAPSD